MRSDAISLSFGLEGFRVIDTQEDADRIELTVTTEAMAGVCPECAGV